MKVDVILLWLGSLYVGAAIAINVGFFLAIGADLYHFISIADVLTVNMFVMRSMFAISVFYGLFVMIMLSVGWIPLVRRAGGVLNQIWNAAWASIAADSNLSYITYSLSTVVGLLGLNLLPDTWLLTKMTIFGLVPGYACWAIRQNYKNGFWGEIRCIVYVSINILFYFNSFGYAWGKWEISGEDQVFGILSNSGECSNRTILRTSQFGLILYSPMHAHPEFRSWSEVKSVGDVGCGIKQTPSSPAAILTTANL